MIEKGALMRRTLVLAALMLMSLGLIAGPATAHDGGWGPMGEHPHALLIGVETVPNPGYDPDDPMSGPPVFPVSWERCVDLAGGKPLPKANHHKTVHQGKAGAALFGAGHMVAPYTCTQLAGMGG
jgi:hypothetical protein